MGRNGGQPSTCCLCTLQFPYIVLGLVPTGFIDLRISFDILLESLSFWKMVSMRFSWLSKKFTKAPFFRVTFSNFLWSLKRYSILLIYVSLSTITTGLPLSCFYWDLLKLQVLLRRILLWVFIILSEWI